MITVFASFQLFGIVLVVSILLKIFVRSSISGEPPGFNISEVISSGSGAFPFFIPASAFSTSAVVTGGGSSVSLV